MRAKDELIAELRANRPSEAEIQARAAGDVDNPEWTDQQLAAAESMQPDAKIAVSLRLDSAVVAAYKATGRGWQTRINEVLRAGLTAETPRFSERQCDALQQFARAVNRSEWAQMGFDSGQSAMALRIAEKLRAVLDGGPGDFTSQELAFLSEVAADFIERSASTIANPMITASTRRNAEWRNVVGQDFQELASLIRAQLKSRARTRAAT